MIKQVSVFLENRPGHLEDALAVLAASDVNIVTLTIADTQDFGVLRMIVNKPEMAVIALRSVGFTCRETDVVAVEIPDTPGALHKVLQVCAENDLNIEYMYVFTEKRGDLAVMIFRFDKPEVALRVLGKANFNILNNQDIIGV